MLDSIRDEESDPRSIYEYIHMSGRLLSDRPLQWPGGGPPRSPNGRARRKGAMRLRTDKLILDFAGATPRWLQSTFGGDPLYRGQCIAPTFALLPPNGELETTYRLQAEQVRRYLTIFLDPDEMCRQLGVEPTAHLAFAPSFCEGGPTLIWQLAHAIRVEHENPSESSTIYVETAVSLLSHEVMRHFSNRPAHKLRPPRGGLAPYQLRRVREYIAANISRDVSLNDLAALVGLTANHFCRAFKASTGLPPHRWHIHQRIEQAQRLMLETGDSLADIATACGFSDQAHFSTAFRKIVGLPPGAWRRARQN